MSDMPMSDMPTPPAAAVRPALLDAAELDAIAARAEMAEQSGGTLDGHRAARDRAALLGHLAALDGGLVELEAMVEALDVARMGFRGGNAEKRAAYHGKLSSLAQQLREAFATGIGRLAPVAANRIRRKALFDASLDLLMSREPWRAAGAAWLKAHYERYFPTTPKEG